MSLPPGWAKAKIGALCDLINGRAFKPADWSPEGIPIIRIQNLNRSSSTFNYCNFEVDPRFIVQPGELLFAWSGTPGTSFGAHIWSGPKAVLNQHIFRVRVQRDEIDKNFFRIAINSTLESLIQRAHGGVGLAHVTRGEFEATDVLLPPLAEQRRIVTKLDALAPRLARSRAEMSKTVDLQRRLKAAICEAAISITADEQPLSNVLTDVRYGTAQKCGYNGSIPVLRIPNVARGDIDLSDMKSADFQPKEIAALSLAVGDILIVRSNGSLDLVGRSAVVKKNAAGMLYAGYLIRLRLDPTKALPAYVQLWLSAPSTRAVIEGLARSSSGVNNINSKQLQALRIRLPDLETQKKRVEAAKAAFARATRLEAEAKMALALIDRLEAAILAKAFRGELVPQDPNDEPAAVLLERIRARRAAEPKPRRGRRPRPAEAVDA